MPRDLTTNADLKNVDSNADSHAANADANDSSNVVQGQYSAVQCRANVVQASLVHAQGKAVNTVARFSNTTPAGGVSVWRAFNAEMRSGRAVGEEEAAGEGRGARSVVEEIIIQVVDMPSYMKARIRALGRAQRVRLHVSFWSRVHESDGEAPDKDTYRQAADEALWEATATAATKGHKVITAKEFNAKKSKEMAAAAVALRLAGEGAMMGGEDRAATLVPLTRPRVHDDCGEGSGRCAGCC